MGNSLCFAVFSLFFFGIAEKKEGLKRGVFAVKYQ
ncbi:hypothetical protein P872_08285 [Rhodonellum psychrophilum GCM71 = DSM 17998]|uniref:Uncharacterized protein n=1 Tax=Rhodonellum psychrophilum GCM71 = DSM 17998 TaxID=1123057 RepID=U5BW95_9BACT|nr:hypothetical protein P872_08285 [Rhodonellum psychrophilum GCM71 = DSM 17998]